MSFKSGNLSRCFGLILHAGDLHINLERQFRRCVLHVGSNANVEELVGLLRAPRVGSSELFLQSLP
jgi:hypothetical protein